MNNIKLLRNAKKLTLKELAQVLGVAESTVSLYENEKRQPDKATLNCLADYFGVSIDYIWCRESQNSTELTTNFIEKYITDNNISEEALNALPASKKNLILSLISEMISDNERP